MQKNWIHQVGEFIGRSAGENSEESGRLLVWKKRFGVFASIVMLILYSALFIMQGQEWGNRKLQVPVAWNSWHTLYDSAPFDSKLNRPATDTILASTTTKADPENIERVQNRGRAPYWIAAEIPQASLNAAADAQAFVLSLGYSSSEFRLWVDDSLISTGTSKTSQSVFIPISEARLRSGVPLKVVFEIKNLAGWTHPDMLERFFASPGFLTAEDAALHTKEMDFLINTRPSILFTLYLVLAIGFLFFWISSPIRQEYFIMFFYCLVLSALQGHLLNFGQNLFSPIGGYRFDIFAFSLEGALSLTIALSFARVKRRYVLSVPILAFLLPLFLISIYQNKDLFQVSSAIQLYLAPPLIFLGAVVCFLQAAYLHFGLQINLKTKERRIKRLVWFGFGLLVIALVHVFQASGVSSDSFRFWCIAHVGMVIFLAVFVVSDYRETEALVGRVPFSAFHRPENLKIPVTGAIVSLDLKRSEVLLVEGARLGDSSVLVNETITLMRHTLSAFGGTLILTDGDAIKCFFPADTKSGIEKAILALTHVQAEIKTLSATLKTEHRLPEDYEISFRAGIAVGTIRPILNSFGGKDYPEWEQAGQSQPFLESARLMEAENSLARTGKSCIVIFKGMNFTAADWEQSSASVKFKHGQIMDVIALRALQS